LVALKINNLPNEVITEQRGESDIAENTWRKKLKYRN
jgi:hypothetical protein